MVPEVLLAILFLAVAAVLHKTRAGISHIRLVYAVPATLLLRLTPH